MGKREHTLFQQRRITMVNVWDYANNLPYVTLKAVGGQVFTGGIIYVEDSEETEADEDGLVLETPDGRIINFLQSEIESIQIHQKGRRNAN